MIDPRLILAALLAAASPVAAQERDMLIIAHRGASAERPEHTLAAYELAIDQGADYIEPDLVATKDLVLVSRHENELSGTTDVASREEFEDRRRDKTIDGQKVAGWFAEDFTLAELRTLRAKERIPSLRPANARFDGLYQVPTLADIVKLVRAKEAETGRRIGERVGDFGNHMKVYDFIFHNRSVLLYKSMPAPFLCFVQRAVHPLMQVFHKGKDLSMRLLVPRDKVVQYYVLSWYHVHMAKQTVHHFVFLGAKVLPNVP